MATLNPLCKAVLWSKEGTDTRHKALLGFAAHLLGMAQPTMVLFNKKEFLTRIWCSMQSGVGANEEKRMAEEQHIILYFESCLALFTHTTP